MRRLLAVAMIMLSLAFACPVGQLRNFIRAVAATDDANYTLHDVRLTGPSGGGVGTFTVRWRYNQVGTQGAVAPAVALVDWDSGLRFGDDVLVSEQKVAVNPQFEELSLSLRCQDDEPTGTNESAGESEAEIYAMVEHLDGSGRVTSLDTLTVTCP
jgi:hypothetical protein